ncbi:MAG: 3-coathanger stack domain-containing protein [Bacteroidota bacterium]
MKNIFVFLITLFPLAINAQTTQSASVQSQGASIEQAAGIYTSTVVVGEPISSGEIDDPVFGGSSFGFLGSTGSNQAPIADAGIDQEVISGDFVQLDGTASSDPDGNTITYDWLSLDGVILTDPMTAQPSFTAPDVLARKFFRFELTVSDGQEMDMDTVVVQVTSTRWVVTPLSNSATFVGTAQLDGIDAAVGDLVAAFANGTARAVDTVFESEGAVFVRFLIQLETTESVTFEVYDVSEDRICEDNTILNVTPGTTVGTPSDPYLIAATCTSGCASGTLPVNDDPIAAGTYRATDKITSTGKVDPFTEVIFEAQNEVQLLPGFHARKDATFTAAIAVCPPAEQFEDRTIYSVPDLRLKVQPNPFFSQTQIHYYLPKNSSKAALRIFDSTNRLLKSIPLSQQQGWHTYDLDAADWLSGMYFVRLQTDEGQLVKKLLLQQ